MGIMEKKNDGLGPRGLRGLGFGTMRLGVWDSRA